MKPRLPIRPVSARSGAVAAMFLALAAATPAAAAAEVITAPGNAEHPLSAPATPHASRAGRCRASIEVSSEQVLAGESVSVSGTVECPEGTEAGGQTVTLLTHTPRGTPGFAPVATATSEPDGSYRMQSPALDENTGLFVRLERGHSARKRVRVTPGLTLSAPASGSALAWADPANGAPATNTVTFAGTVTATRPALVVLQGELPAGSGRWRRIAVTHVDESGDYALTHTFRRAGTVTVRVLVRSGGAGAIATSAPLTYTIAPRVRAARNGHPHAARNARPRAARVRRG